MTRRQSSVGRPSGRLGHKRVTRSARSRWLRVSQSAVSFSCRHAGALCPHCCRLGWWGPICGAGSVLFPKCFPAVSQIILDCPVSATELVACLLQYVDVSVPSLGRSPGVGNGNPLQCSCLEEPVDGGAWQGTVHGVIKSETRLKQLCTDIRNLLKFP